MYPLQVLNKKDVKGDADDDAEDYTLTPGTDAHYRQVDQEYAKVMQQTPRSELVSVAEISSVWDADAEGQQSSRKSLRVYRTESYILYLSGYKTGVLSL